MHLDPSMSRIIFILIVVIIAILFFKAIGQPNPVAYLIVGILLGPHCFDLIQNPQVIDQLGTIGVVFLLFFAGLEFSLNDFTKNWKIPLLGTLFQVLGSLCLVYILGLFIDWPIKRVVLLGFVISLSSTSMVIQLLRGNNELKTSVGKNVLSILLMQDLFIIPMVVILGMFHSDTVDVHRLSAQMIGIGLIALAFYLIKIGLRKNRLLHFFIDLDHDLQVFFSLLIILGMSFISSYFYLSAALGAFLSGIMIASVGRHKWFENSLIPLKIIFMALFFISVGMLLDFKFMLTQMYTIVALVALVFLTNTFINAVSLKLLNVPWRDSLYCSALLSQIGEFSFFLAAIGLHAAIISHHAYQLTVSVITISMVLTPLWVFSFKRILYRT